MKKYVLKIRSLKSYWGLMLAVVFIALLYSIAQKAPVKIVKSTLYPPNKVSTCGVPGEQNIKNRPQ
jgi:hypothetical protein